jgi:hypothetical protein
MKNLFFSFLLFIAAGASNAQVGFGPELGVGLSTLRFAPATAPILYTSGSVSPVFSIKLGGLIDVPLNRHAYFQTGLYLSEKGGESSFSYYDSATSNEFVKRTLHFTYLELPLVVVVKTSEQGYGRFIAGIGAVPSYLLSGSYKYNVKGANVSGPFDISNSGHIGSSSDFNSFDMGLMLTAGFEIPGGIFLRGYFLTGATDLSPNTEIIKNRMFGVSAGYIMGKGRSIKKKKSDLIDITPDDHQ